MRAEYNRHCFYCGFILQHPISGLFGWHPALSIPHPTTTEPTFRRENANQYLTRPGGFPTHSGRIAPGAVIESTLRRPRRAETALSLSIPSRSLDALLFLFAISSPRLYLLYLLTPLLLIKAHTEGGGRGGGVLIFPVVLLLMLLMLLLLILLILLLLLCFYLAFYE